MSNDKNAQELLKWGLANSSSTAVGPRSGGPSIEQISSDIEAGRRPDLADPRLYDAIMGKSEAQMMREELSVATSTHLPLNDRLTALDNFEMLIEQIDNSNNITSMNMWSSIIQLLSAPEPEIQTAAAWIVGTAVQNNDKAQMAVLEYGTVQALVDLLQSPVEEVRAKAMYALSGVLKHNPKAMSAFHVMDGWKVLRAALRDPCIGVRRKSAFLCNALLVQDPNSFDSVPQATSTSSATAVAPVQTSTAGPAVPLERGPETMLSNVPHPNVSQALLNSGILTTLISSLLAPNTNGVNDGDLPPPSGPNGDADPRSDLDFAEKATTAIFTFTSKLPNSTDALDATTKTLFRALLEQLQHKPLDDTDGAATRWAELGIEKSDFEQFKHKIGTL